MEGWAAKVLVFATLSCCMFLPCTWCLERLSLVGSGWTVEGKTNTTSYKLKATVPGGIYTDLVKAGHLKDPYYRMNDVDSRWVAYNNWTYSRQFAVPASLLAHKYVQLVCDGVDTVANVSINGQHVASINNMFRRYVLDVKLKAGNNIIAFNFTSPVTYAADQARHFPYPVPDQCRPSVEHGECNMNFIRKSGSSFGWDWGPAFPNMGIWKPLAIVGYSSAILKAVTVFTSRANDSLWIVSGSVYFDAPANQPIQGTVLIQINGNIKKTFPVSLKGDTREFKYAVPLDKATSQKVALWWPNGYGTQTLYTMDATFTSQDKKDTDKKSVKFGFRTVELVQDTIANATGLTFYFKVNGVPIFMKGSNWIPADALQGRITEDYLRRLLTSAATVHMNMLRVWGGGVYESDTLYGLCDELGIMIWQDFMFACTLYPANDAFLDNVRAEVKDQVQRLSSHPSIALWAGNNENVEIIVDVKDPKGYYHRDYVKLYIDTIRQTLLQIDTSRPFVSSSPANGAETEKENWTPKRPNDPLYGDNHHYDYNKDTWKWRNVPVPRFGSEYGLQSWCSMESLRKVSVPGDLTMDSDFASHRQHHTDGNKQMQNEFSMHVRLPNITNATQQFENFIYFSQINQAMGIKTIAEVYRRSQSACNKKGYGMTMGSLYWQLNDIWQAPTWASMEYGGKWKMLHYFARHFYSPKILSPYLDGDIVKVVYIEDRIRKQNAKSDMYIRKYGPFNKEQQLYSDSIGKTNDISSAYASGHTLIIQCFSWKSMSPLKKWTSPFPASPSLAAYTIYQESLTTLLQEAKCPSHQHCFLLFSMEDEKVPSNFLFLDDKLYNAVGMINPKVKVQNVKQLGDNLYSLDVVASAVAPFVWLEATGIDGYFSDNGFLMTTSKVHLQFNAWAKTTSNNLAKALTVKSLMSV